MSLLSFLQKSYIRTIAIFFIIILIVNLILIGLGHFDSEPEEGGKKFKRDYGNTMTDGLYFTTTQFSTIGYGDITPKTQFSKWICAMVHFTVIAITLKLFSEFGIMNKIDKETIHVLNIANDSNTIKNIQLADVVSQLDTKKIPFCINKIPLKNIINANKLGVFDGQIAS